MLNGPMPDCMMPDVPATPPDIDSWPPLGTS